MPVIRINALGDRPEPHGSRVSLNRHIGENDSGDGPVIAMIHGYKYLPAHPRRCPHRHIFTLRGDGCDRRSTSWLRPLGFGTGHAREGLALTFGWPAYGMLWQVQERVAPAGRALAKALFLLHRKNPGRPIHLIGHSLGVGVALEALRHLPHGAVGRIISMTGASYQSHAAEILESDRGRATEFLNVTSRENDAFDFLYERLIAPPRRGDRAIGHGLKTRNAVTLQLDCPETLDHLARLGQPVAPPDRRICHWSAYTRPGILRLYNAVLRHPEAWPLSTLRAGLPDAPARRWSRLVAAPSLALPLPFTQNAS